MKAVKFEKFGHADVLKVEEVARPVPKANQVLIKVKAAGINPGEVSIREGWLDKIYPTTFPSGQGSDLAGIIEEVGEGVTEFKAGDEVLGFTNYRGSHAEYVIADADTIIPKPASIPWEVAGSLFVVGSTAYASVKAVALKPGDTVVVSAAAGGVGSLAVQLAKEKGAKVIGLAGKDNQQWLIDHGIIGVIYGDGQEERIKTAANGKVDAFMDTFGKGYVDLALQLGVPKDRINTIIDFDAVQKYGVKSDGSDSAANTNVLKELAGLITAGKLEIDIAKTFPLSEVREAFKELEQRHTHGKIVLIP